MSRNGDSYINIQSSETHCSIYLLDRCLRLFTGNSVTKLNPRQQCLVFRLMHLRRVLNFMGTRVFCSGCTPPHPNGKHIIIPQLKLPVNQRKLRENNNHFVSTFEMYVTFDNVMVLKLWITQREDTSHLRTMQLCRTHPVLQLMQELMKTEK
jgi:hypothetical protein